MPQPRFLAAPIALATVLALASLTGPGAHAQAPQAAAPLRLDLPSQPLGQALNALAREARLQLLVRPDLVAGKTAPAVSGQMSVHEALERVLAGSGLMATSDGQATIVRPVPAPVAATALPAVTVTANADQPGQLPKPFAGGQVARGGQLGMLGNTALLDAPFNVTGYTAELMQNQQARTVMDVVANDPSVRSATSPGSYYEQFFIRGFSSEHADETINGLFGMAPFNRSSIEAMERVEVLKGPSAMLNGMPPDGGVGGVISLVPKRAADLPLTRLGVSYDSRARYGTHVDVGRRFGENHALGIRVNGVYRNGEGPIRGEDQKLQLGSLALDYRGERARWAIDAYAQNARQDGGSGGHAFAGAPGPVPDASRPMFLGDRAELSDRMAMFTGEYDLGRDVTAFAKYGQHRAEVMGVRATGIWSIAPDGGYRGALAVQDFRYDTRAGELGLRTNLATGPVQHRLVVSATQHTEQDKGAEVWPGAASLVDSNIYDPVPLALPAQALGARRQTYALRLRSLSLVDTLSMLDGRLLLTLGLRRQEVLYRTTANHWSGAGEQKESAVSPVAALVVKPWQNASLYANYIEGLTRGPTAPTGTGLVNAGESFPPYKTRQYEIGAKAQWDGLGGSLSWFQIAQPNALTRNNRFTLDGEQRNRGVELNLYGEPRRGVRLLGGLTLMDAKIRRATPAIQGNDAFGIPKRQASFGGEWDLGAVPGLTLSARVLHTGGVYINSANTHAIPSWTRWDAGARYATQVAGKPVVLRASVENLFDRNYWASNRYETWLSRSAPRRYLLSATVDF